MNRPMDTEQSRRYWDDAAAEYDSAPDHGLLDSDTRSAWKDLVRTWLPARPSLIADLACGTGTMSALMAELGHEVRGIDLAAQMVVRARAKTAPFGRAVQIAQADAGAPPFEPGSFDAVFARHILWTLPDPTDALARWTALLRPGGRLVLVEGRWSEEGDDGDEGDEGDEGDRDKGDAGVAPAPWSNGVPSTELADVVADLVGAATVVQLSDAVYWGREIQDERYLVTATLPVDGPSSAYPAVIRRMPA